MLLVLRWQVQSVTQTACRLIDGETGTVGRDFEQNPARLAEVDGVKIEAIDDGRYMKAEPNDLLAPVHLLRVVRAAKCNVMHRAGGIYSERAVRSLDQVELRAGQL